MNIAEKITRAKADIDAVYEGGKAKALSEAESINADLEKTLYGTDTGGKSFYDEFWDTYQANGTQADYDFYFAGYGWNEKTFLPKYNIRPKTATYMFRDVHSSTWGGWDLVEHLEKLGVELDFSRCTNVGYLFHWSTCFTRIGVVDISNNSGTATLVFGNCTKLHTIEKLITSETVIYSQLFTGDTALENLIIEGVIGQNGFNVQQCPLSHDSIMSIINALKDYSGTDTWKSVTLGADNIAKLTEQELAIMTNKQWEFG